MKYILFVIMIGMLAVPAQADFNAELCSLAGMCELFEPDANGELWFETRDESVLDHFAMNGWRGTDDKWYPVQGEFTCIDDITEPPASMQGKTVLFWRTSEYLCMQEFDQVWLSYLPAVIGE